MTIETETSLADHDLRPTNTVGPSLSRTELIARSVAVGTTRREFLGWVCRGVFVLFASSAMVGSVFTESAQASVCGSGSPFCPSGSCGHTKCQNNPGGTCKNTSYGHGTCSTSYPGCWYGGSHFMCCDCCCTNATGNDCSSCGGSYKKCRCIMTI